jgi:hypothetical protein
VSIASNMETASSISGRLSGLASQHRFITFARELGQHLGISGLRFWDFNKKTLPKERINHKEFDFIKQNLEQKDSILIGCNDWGTSR